MPRLAPDQNYSRDQLLRVAGVPERQLRIWERAGLINENDEYTLHDLRAVQTLVRLKEAGLGPKRIRHVFAEIREKLSGVTNPLKEVTVLIENRRIRVLVDGHRMEAESGQLLLNFDQQQITRMLAFPVDRKPQKDREQPRQSEAANWFQRGLELEATGVASEAAVAAYEKAIELDPRCVGALVNLGTVAFHGRQWKRAESYYKRALEIEPEYALGHFNLGNLYDERGDWAQAAHHYLQALRIAPNYADAHYNYALLCQRTGQVMKAVRHWRAYLKLDPSSTWAEVARRELARLRETTVVRSERTQSDEPAYDRTS